ncbi:ras-like GTP-binding protein rhoa [Plakobranchus ocellatus]|uniref:Ras-like GTP-binding protein rhoa n=1 Tax=Plakobranchus ocellatus TaxID=259542 RepID=A0AAV4BLW9_9GAST|nr:ras-like GTP-binding protein rhoa [Plakobranchus ocellatus]
MEFLCCYSQSNPLLEPTPLSVAVIGDPGCGKTSLIYRFSRGHLPLVGQEISASLDTDKLDIVHSNRQIALTLCETSGHEDDARVRALAYKCDVIILCFPLDSTEAQRRVVSEWAPEVTLLKRGKPFLLVGTKRDLRDEAKKKIGSKVGYVSKAVGKKIAKQIGAKAFFECSVIDSDSEKVTKRIFGRAIREGLKSS